ncbi:DUF937 domain-containing protein [Microbacterium sp. NPDC008134]|uniref:DUF937 domain-containing protein n=1 Tax=Microbacterium sp. NPDC008134 TaxID=3364183 RepID=UPI0036E19DCC
MALDDILKQVPIDDIAKQLGVSPDVAKTAVEQGGAVLLGGLAKNASTDEGSAAIQKALKKHEGTGGAASVKDIDQADGDKIVAHILGADEKKKVTEKLTQSDKTAGIDFGKLLPILAPIVMGLIANAGKGKTESASTESQGGGGIGDIIGGLLGGGSNGGGIDLGSIVGGLFGGKK